MLMDFFAFRSLPKLSRQDRVQLGLIHRAFSCVSIHQLRLGKQKKKDYWLSSNFFFSDPCCNS